MAQDHGPDPARTAAVLGELLSWQRERRVEVQAVAVRRRATKQGGPG
ncbi:hypothetical protein [Flavonifractor hominis]|uniref:Uncharacterized protein n=1 Tax=Flavonifractor hominis TaxID=3133178 RepID=A0ABV1ERS5_9FIRM